MPKFRVDVMMTVWASIEVEANTEERIEEAIRDMGAPAHARIFADSTEVQVEIDDYIKLDEKGNPIVEED